jgi:hypothetical protein
MLFNRVSAVALVLLGFPVTNAIAQACVGLPIADRETALTANASFGDDEIGVGAALFGNIDGPFTLGGGYAMTNIPDAANNLSRVTGDAVFELSSGRFSACAVSGVSYGWISGEQPGFTMAVSAQTITIPVGLGLGKTLWTTRRATITSFIVPQYLLVRTHLEDVDGAIFSETSYEHEFGAVLGAALGGRRWFGTGPPTCCRSTIGIRGTRSDSE